MITKNVLGNKKEDFVLRKSAILFGSPELLHMQRFITLLLSEEDGFDELVVFNISETQKLSERDIAFYKNRGVKILCCEPKKYTNRLLRGVLNYIKRKHFLKQYLRKHNAFDYCFIHYCAWQNVLWVAATKRAYKQIVPVFYGGDVLRNKRLGTPIYRRFLDIASHIVLPNENSYRVFQEKTNGRYTEKVYSIQFPSGACERMLARKDAILSEEARIFFGIPQTGRIVLCGHTATRAEQYEKMIDELEKCKCETVKNCCFVFFMTYGHSDYRAYQEEIEERLKGSKLRYVILKEFVAQEDMVKLHYASDIHITTIKTDGFSCFFQEEMLAGNVVIYGKWLNYFEIENEDCFAFPLNSFEDISGVLDDVVANYEIYAKKSAINISGLIDMVSDEAVRKDWKIKVFSGND